jgi:hypothetical protein
MERNVLVERTIVVNDDELCSSRCPYFRMSDWIINPFCTLNSMVTVIMKDGDVFLRTRECLGAEKARGEV